MPRAPLHYCTWPGCSAKVAGRFCRTHAAAQEHRRPNWDVRRWYRTVQWKTLRADVLRTDPFCEDCRVNGAITLATEVHHRVRHEGDPEKFFDRARLGGLCAECHSRRTGRGE